MGTSNVPKGEIHDLFSRIYAPKCPLNQISIKYVCTLCISVYIPVVKIVFPCTM